jgi:hypothetical protein
VISTNSQNHLDQEIVRLIDQSREEGYSFVDIKTGTVVLSGIRVNFEEKTLLDDKLKMILPTDFQSIPPENVYKPEARPDLLLADETGAIQITIAHTRKKVGNDEDVTAYQNEVRDILQALNSSVEWLEGGIKETNGKRVTYFELITPMLGTRIYNLTFFLELQQRVLTGNFVCSESKLKAWKPIFYQMIDSIEIVANETGDEVIAYRDYSNYHFNQGLYLVHHGQEYLSFKIGENEFRLISTNPSDLQNGFTRKDGVFKKTVGIDEIEAAYELKLIITYREYQFEMGQQLAREIQLIARNCAPDIRDRLQLQMASSREYEKWVNKNEIENVEEKRLPVDGFAMPEALSQRN